MRISSERINWGVAVGELVLIVVGILMALGIDSYAQGRSDAAVADAYLRDLALELQADSAQLESRSAEVGGMIASASELLRALDGSDEDIDDLATLLMGSLFGEGITPDPVVWEELRTTGSLRLLPDAEVRSAIVSHYLDRAARFGTIDENFSPAVRALRALAWDVLPVQSFTTFFQTGRSGVPDAIVLARLRDREDAEFLLKRLILTGTVARGNIRSLVGSTSRLLDQISL